MAYGSKVLRKNIDIFVFVVEPLHLQISAKSQKKFVLAAAAQRRPIFGFLLCEIVVHRSLRYRSGIFSSIPLIVTALAKPRPGI